ncbi:serine hydrolase domain-containing protein [Millisia brevis]|uniref:serine hydrolase domain-containing protein n=1 Tax=Millisia brevis TaxID=264148 RepID=UPI000A063C79|nr:serine hydrolase domain-containing protein [Millisia brevis]
MRTSRLRARLTAAVTAILLVGAGCTTSSGTSTTGPSTTAPSTDSASSADASSGGGASLDRLTPIVRDLLDDMSVPGAVVLVDTGEQRYLEAFGTRSLDGGAPVETGDHFRIGSITKTMTGTALLQLVAEGQVALDDPVADYLPDVPGGDRITITDLLDMRSGLDSYTTEVSFNRVLDEDPTRVWEPRELAALGTALPPVGDPGTTFLYSNTNTVLAGLIVEEVSGTDLGTRLRETLFDPLDLAGTRFPAITDNSLTDPHPQGYLYGTNVSTIESAALPEPELAQARAGTLLPNDVTDMNPSWGWAAGAGISTAQDLARWVEALVGGGLLPDELQRTRIDSVVPIDPDNPDSASYGLALARFGPMLGHDGSLPGFQSFLGHDLQTGTTLVVLTTLQFAPDGRAPANEVARLIMASL